MINELTLLVVGASAVALLLAWLEWRRSDPSRRWLRVSASTVACAALAMLAFPRPDVGPAPAGGGAEAIVWTAGDGDIDISVPAEIMPSYRFALPDATARPPDAIVVPDIAWIRRHHPEIRRLVIRGGGLEPFDVTALAGLELKFERSANTARSAPVITVLNFPREVALGGRVRLQGRVEGLKPGESVALLLTAPDGSSTTATCSSEDAVFEIAAPPSQAEGRFVWRLKMTAGEEGGPVLAEEQIGIAVVATSLPRVLALSSGPGFEIAHLQRWFAELGGSFRARMQVARDRYQFVGSAGEPTPFPTVDAELLAGVDLLVVDLRALAALTEPEQQAVRAAVQEGGLGLMVQPAGERSWPSALNDLVPWSFTEAVEETGTRLARLSWRDLAAPIETPVAIEPFSFKGSGDALVRDSQGRAVVHAAPIGRGQVALSLVRETWRWRLENQAANFAQYWSFLFSRLAKAEGGDAKKWSVENAEHAPLFVDQPVELRYTTTAERVEGAMISGGETGEQISLPLAQSVDEPTSWRGTFWPRRAGWHRVAGPGGEATLDFFVQGREEWQSLSAGRRGRATEVFATLSRKEAPERSASAVVKNDAVSAGSAFVLFALFLLCSGYLWAERRRATQRVTARAL